MTPTSTDCECAGPGVCWRHRCVKTRHWHRLCLARPDYFRLWEEGRGPGQSPEATRRFATRPTPTVGPVRSCVHRDGVARRAHTSAGTVAVRACARHGECIDVEGEWVRGRDGPLPVCSRCPDRRPTGLASHVGPLHVYMHVWPVAGNGAWQWNVDQFLRRIDLFNGRRIVGIATSPGADPPERVVEACAGYDCEFVVRENDADRREVVTMEPALRMLRDEPGATLVAHAKGVSRPRGDFETWTALLWSLCCDHPELVVEALGRVPLVGPFRKRSGFERPGTEGWHYHGGFYWVRNEAVAARRAVPEAVWHGSESFPARWFDLSEGEVVFVELEDWESLYGHLRTVHEYERRYARWRHGLNRSRTSSPTA
jgi:hypothetical protein